MLVLLAAGILFAQQHTGKLFTQSIVFAQAENDSDQSSSEGKLVDSFKTEATSTYTVHTAGTTRVEHRFTITNLKPTTYLKQYSIKLQFPSVTEIAATSQGQAIKPYVVKDGPATSITLNFDDDVVGEGKTRVFTIAYTTKDVATGSGNVLEVRIPAFSSAQENQHVVYLNTPLKYGRPVRTNPNPDRQTTVGETLQLQYNRFPNDGISVLFGSEQTYDLITTYKLTNPSSSLGYTQIALPPDTSYQRMEYRLLEPRPQSMKIDEDGNWIATYLLEANTTVAVRVETQVTVTLEPDPFVPIIQPVADHVAEKPFWQSSAASVKNLAQSAMLHDIYNNVIKALSYDTERVKQGDITNRLGAEQALASPTAAVCQEYADVLIAAWRSVGVPARRLNGYAFSQNQETRPSSFRGTVLHAWVDYFDQASSRWRMVDPTWEDTTGGVDYFSEFDLNHIVLSINGISSSDPAPAGSYTESPEDAHLEVKVATATASAQPAFSATVTPRTAFGLKIPGAYTVTLENETGRAWYDTHVTLTTDAGTTVTPSQQTSTFLPFEQKIFTSALTTPLTDGWRTVPLTVTVVTAGQSEPYVITKENLTATPTIIAALATINPTTPVGVVAILCFLTAGSLLVFRRKRKTPIRRQSQKPQETTQQLPPATSIISPDSADGAGSGNDPVAGTRE